MTASSNVLAIFQAQRAGVEELLNFDRFVLDHVVGGLGEIADRLEARGRHNEATDVRNRLAVIRNIRSADSLRPRYETIFNQCVVLLVSYFGSTMGDLFRAAVTSALSLGLDVPVIDQSVQVTWRRLGRVDVQVPELIAEALVEQQKISFQDMQSTGRAFRENLGFDLPRDEATNDIILGQAARHVIVHAAGTVDDRMINQLRSAVPRRLKRDLVRGAAVQFDPDEVRQLATSMTDYLNDVASRVDGLTRARPAQ